MTGQQLKNSILQLAVQGKLVPQDPADEPASVLLSRIREEKEQLIHEKKIKRKKNPSQIFRGEDGHFYERVGKADPVCIDEELPFEIPETWEWARLGNILSVKGGKRVPKGYALLDAPTDHIYIRVTDMKNNTLTTNKLKYISNEIFEQIKNYTISKDDLYLTIAGTIGNAGVVPDIFDGMNLTENAVKLTEIKINKLYVLLTILSPFIQDQFVDKTNKVAQPKLAIKRIESTLFPLPPLAEQQRIVAKIEELLPYVERYEESQNKLETLNTIFPDQLKKSILQEAIQGKLVPQDPADEPASALLERIHAEKEQLIKDGKIKREKNPSQIFRGEDGHFYERVGKNEPVCIDEELPFEIPETWEWTRLQELATKIGSGSTPTGGRAVYVTSGIKFIRSQNVYNDGLHLNDVAYIPDEINAKKPNSIVQAKDILLNITGGSIGRCAIVPDDFDIANINQHVMIIRQIDPALRFWIHSVLISNYIQDLIMDVQVGVSREGLSATKIKAFFIPMPPLAEQQHIIEKLEQLNVFIDQLTKS